MNIIITGKDLKATDAIKEYVNKKLERIKKYFEDDEINVSVKIKSEKNAQIAEMQVNVKSYYLKAVTETKDLYASIDKDIDILEGQIRKIKTKKEKMNKEESIRLKENNSTEKLIVMEKEVIKTLYYDIKPISVEDAKIKLNYLLLLTIYDIIIIGDKWYDWIKRHTTYWMLNARWIC